MAAQVSLFLAFLAGFVSFLSPCVLPLIPGYLSFITGVSFNELQEAENVKRGKIFLPSLYFVLGFSLVFIALGASASFIGSFFLSYRQFLTKIAAVLIIFFGLSLMGLVKLTFFQKQRAVKKLSRSPLGILMLGMSFSLAWTPCVGPVLTSILAFASTSQTVAKGALLLAFYALGLGLPFILTGFLFNHFTAFFNWIKTRYQLISVASGFILIIMGLLLLTNQLNYFNAWLRSVAVKMGWPTL